MSSLLDLDRWIDDGGSSGETIWTYHFGLPNRASFAAFTHLIWWKHDPPETMARGSGKRDPFHWKKAETDPPAVWAQRIEALLEDGEPRTFNRICVELCGTSASIFFETGVDKGLWKLVKEHRLVWACEDGAVFFLHADALIERD